MTAPAQPPPSSPPFYEPPPFGRLARFFWFNAGADAEILEDCTYAEHVKFACMGGVVLGTGVLAAISMSVALMTVFPQLHGAWRITLALLWGLLIWNVDRFVVASTGKGGGPIGKRWGDWANLVGRLLMAIVLAVAISKPLEVQIFRKEIDAWMAEEQAGASDSLRRVIEREYGERKLRLAATLTELERRRRVSDSAMTHAKRMADDENQGIGPTGLPFCGPQCRYWKSRQLEEETLHEQLSATLAGEMSNLAAIDSLIDGRLKELQANQQKANTLLASIRTLHRNAGSAATLITLLLIVIEAMPVIFKFSIGRGPYDDREENVRALLRAQAGIEVHGNQVTYHGERHHLVMLRERQRAQEEATRYALEAWRREMQRQVDEDPERFVTRAEGPDGAEPDRPPADPAAAPAPPSGVT